MPDEDLRQADLSHLRIEDMTDAQRAELRRRYNDFVERVLKRPSAAVPAAPTKKVAKWMPAAMPSGRRRG